MKRDKLGYGKRHGFTLIEMLIVIVIILILSGMVLKIMTLVSRKASVSRCAHDLLQIENALAEYYAEYGQYPPGTSPDGQRNVDYEFENDRLPKGWFRDSFLPNHTNLNNMAEFFPDVFVYYDYIPSYLDGIPKGHQVDPKYKYDNTHGKWGLGYHYGLTAHLWPRDVNHDPFWTGDQVHWYRKDTERDVAVKKRWAHFLSDLNFHYREGDRRHYLTGKSLESTAGSGRYEGHIADAAGSKIPFSNNVYTILDPWWNGYYYECKAPYYSYKLWSSGSDERSYIDPNTGRDYTKDDVHAGVN